MTRIIGGLAGGRRLRTPEGDATRPTSDRVREALFSAVDAGWGDLEGARVADLFAGSGAVGLEAASRGASEVWLVESDRRTARLIEHNVRELDLPATVTVSAVPVLGALAAGSSDTSRRRSAQGPFDLVFLDPPYPLSEDALAAVLGALDDDRWLAEDAWVVVERSSRSPEPRWPAGMVLLRSRRYGETVLWYVRRDRASVHSDVPAEKE